MRRLTKGQLKAFENRVDTIEKYLTRESTPRNERAKLLWELRSIERQVKFSLVISLLTEGRES